MSILICTLGPSPDRESFFSVFPLFFNKKYYTFLWISCLWPSVFTVFILIVFTYFNISAVLWEQLWFVLLIDHLMFWIINSLLNFHWWFHSEIAFPFPNVAVTKAVRPCLVFMFTGHRDYTFPLKNHPWPCDLVWPMKCERKTNVDFTCLHAFKSHVIFAISFFIIPVALWSATLQIVAPSSSWILEWRQLGTEPAVNPC